MPVYLLHGFKWPRPLIRIHIILQNLDDAAAEWLISPATTECLLDNFHTLYPDQMKHLPNLRFVEQFDPEEESSTANGPSQPFAYVADVCVEVKLGINIDESRGKGVMGAQWQALMELRDKIAPEERPGWFVVVCRDEERLAPSSIDLPAHSVRVAENGAVQNVVTEMGVPKPMPVTAFSANSSVLESELMSSDKSSDKRNNGPSRGFRKFIGGFTRRKSHANLLMRENMEESQPHPPPSTSSSKATDTAPRLPPVSPNTSRLPPRPSVITNDNLVPEVNWHARTMSAISPLSLTEPLVELSTSPPSRAGEESSRSPFVSPIGHLPPIPGPRCSGTQPVPEARSRPVSEIDARPVSDIHSRPVSEIHSRPVSEIHPRRVSEILSRPVTEIHSRPVTENNPRMSMPTALFQRISDAPRPDPLRSNPFSPELREAQSVVKRRPVPTRASLPPLQTHELEGTLPQHSREHDPVAPAPIVLPAPAQSKSPNKRDRRALQKSSPGSSVCRHASFRKTDTHMEVLSNEDGIECVIITMQPGASTPSRKTSARRSRDGSRSDKRSSYYSERPSDTSPVKDDGSPGPSRPRVVHSPSRSVSSRKCSGVIEISYRPEFGQRLSQFDIVATKIENALNELR